MKYIVPPFITEVAHKAAAIPGVKRLLKPFFYAYKDKVAQQRNEHFKKNALDVLKRFDKALTDANLEYTLAFGTLLGAVREKGFIKHDMDMDVAMWAEDWSPRIRKCLEDAGFKLWHSFEIDDGKLGREETYAFNNVAIDIFFFYPPINEYPYCCDFLGFPDAATYRQCNEKHGGALPRRIEIPMRRGRVLTKFEDTELYIPTNAHDLLSFRYGESYMIPNPNWGIRSNDTHIIEWTDKRGVYREI